MNNYSEKVLTKPVGRCILYSIPRGHEKNCLEVFPMKKLVAILVAMTMILAGVSALADTLVMGTNAQFPPYEYVEGGEVVGIDAEVAQAICDKLGYELEIQDMEFNSIISAVQSGNVDFGMAGMTVTEDRLKNVDFSESYATGVQVVIVKADSDYQKPEDLTGKKVGVQLATTGDIYASASVDEGGYGEENVEKFSKGADAIIALKQDKIDAVIIDNEPAKEFVKANEGLRILDTEYTTEDYAMAFAKGNTEMINKVNGALKELIADGTVQKIIDKYIKAD